MAVERDGGFHAARSIVADGVTAHVLERYAGAVECRLKDDPGEAACPVR
jgi:hypothetical protein